MSSVRRYGEHLTLTPSEFEEKLEKERASFFLRSGTKN
jgi:hypothetical protein